MEDNTALQAAKMIGVSRRSLVLKLGAMGIRPIQELPYKLGDPAIRRLEDESRDTPAKLQAYLARNPYYAEDMKAIICEAQGHVKLWEAVIIFSIRHAQKGDRASIEFLNSDIMGAAKNLMGVQRFLNEKGKTRERQYSKRIRGIKQKSGSDSGNGEYHTEACKAT